MNQMNNIMHRRDLKQYLKWWTVIHHSSLSKLSKRLVASQNARYISHSLSRGSDISLKNCLSRLAQKTTLNLNDMATVLRVGKTSIPYRHMEHGYLQTSPKLHNYFWWICKRQGSDIHKAAKYSQLTVGSVKMSLYNAHLSLPTIARLSVGFGTSPKVAARAYGFTDKESLQRVVRYYEQAKNRYNNRYLKRVRKQMGLTQAQMAKKLHTVQTNISANESGVGRANLSTLMRYSHYCNVPLIDLLHHSQDYSNIEYQSPAYLILAGCVKADMSISELAHKMHTTAKTLLSSLYRSRDGIKQSQAERVCQILNLPSDYFKVTYSDGEVRLRLFKKHLDIRDADHFFGYHVERLCVKHHMTQSDLGHKLGVSGSRGGQLTHMGHVTKKTLKKLIACFPNDKEELIKANHLDSVRKD